MKYLFDFKFFNKDSYLMIVSFILLIFLLFNSFNSILNIDVASNDYVETSIDIDLDDEVQELISEFNIYKILKSFFFLFSFKIEVYLVNNFPIKAMIPPPDYVSRV